MSSTSSRGRGDVRVGCENLPKDGLVLIFELVFQANQSHLLICLREKFQSFSMQVHFGVEKMEHGKFEILETFIFELLDLTSFTRDSGDNFYLFFENLESLGEIA